MAESLLSTRSLVAGRKGRVRLDVSDWQVEPGEFWVVLGPNGGGKSTLFDTFAGLIPPLEGEILLGGRPANAMTFAERACLMSSVGQREETPEGFTLREAVVMGRLPRSSGRWESAEDWARADASLDRLDLAGLAGRRSEETSGGEFQRALIARVLATEAPLILLDEPTSSIDAEHLQRLGDILREEALAGRGVVVSTHNLEWAIVFADHFAVVDDGRVEPVADRQGVEAWIKKRFAPEAMLEPTSAGQWALSMGYRRTSHQTAEQQKTAFSCLGKAVDENVDP